MSGQLICGDSLIELKKLPEASVDLVIADPPYYRIDSSEWDKQWKTFSDYLDWIEQIALEIKRILKKNGSFYIFGDDENIAYIQVRLDKHFTFLNHLIWFKRNNQSIKNAKNNRRFSCVSERILFYSVQDTKSGLQGIYENPECFKQIKEYMRTERQKIIEEKKFNTQEQFNDYINELTETRSVVSRHYFSDSQWVFPTKDIYEKMQTTGFFTKPYENLRQEYENLRQEYENLRRPFSYVNTYEILDIPIINSKENSDHPTTKPIKLIKILIEASTKNDSVVLDPFLGSGTTALACEKLNRKWIGIELNQDYVNIAQKRLDVFKGQTRLGSLLDGEG